MQPSELRPLGVGEMVDGAIRLYRTHFVTLLRISALILGPIGLIELLGAIAVGPVQLNLFLEVDPNATFSEVMEPLIPLYAVSGLTGLLSFLGSVVVQGASIMALTQSYQGETPSWQASLRTGVRRFLPLALATILVGLGTAGPFLAMILVSILAVAAAGPAGLLMLLVLIPAAIVGAIYLFVSWTVTPAAVIAENLGPIRAMGRSLRLVKGRFWPVLGAVLLAYLLYFVVSQLVGTVTSMLSFTDLLDGGTISLVPLVVGSALVSIVSAPFVAAMITIVYFDLRVRKEGYDLELMARDLERMERPSTTPRPDDPFGLGDPGSG